MLPMFLVAQALGLEDFQGSIDLGATVKADSLELLKKLFGEARARTVELFRKGLEAVLAGAEFIAGPGAYFLVDCVHYGLAEGFALEL